MTKIFLLCLLLALFTNCVQNNNRSKEKSEIDKSTIVFRWNREDQKSSRLTAIALVNDKVYYLKNPSSLKINNKLIVSSGKQIHDKELFQLLENLDLTKLKNINNCDCKGITVNSFVIQKKSKTTSQITVDELINCPKTSSWYTLEKIREYFLQLDKNHH